MPRICSSISVLMVRIICTASNGFSFFAMVDDLSGSPYFQHPARRFTALYARFARGSRYA